MFPLCFLRGLEAQLVAIGGSALDCCLLQDKVRTNALLMHGWLACIAVSLHHTLACLHAGAASH